MKKKLSEGQMKLRQVLIEEIEEGQFQLGLTATEIFEVLKSLSNLEWEAFPQDPEVSM